MFVTRGYQRIPEVLLQISARNQITPLDRTSYRIPKWGPELRRIEDVVNVEPGTKHGAQNPDFKPSKLIQYLRWKASGTPEFPSC